MVRPVRPVIVFVLIGLLAGCDDLSAFGGEFNGSIVQGNFVRSCFPPNTKATLRFDPDRAVGDVPELPSGTGNWLTTSDGTFKRTPLEPIQKLADDQLSRFDFPGPERLRNYIMLARPSEGPLANRDAIVVISLLESGRVELRVIGRTADTRQACTLDVDAGVEDTTSETAGPREYFGFFQLKSS
jgi:hypothetical protein